jgi:hypothetical protein
MTAHRIHLAFALVLTLAPLAQGASGLTPRERATVIAARHLLTSIGSPALAAAVRDRSMRADAYWQNVFRAAQAAELYREIAEDLHRAMNDVPLVKGRPAEPDVFARAVLRGIGPMPMRPLDEAPEAERRAVLAFARKELADFSRVAFDAPENALPESLAVAAKARAVFHSPAIGDAFEKMGRLLGGNDEDRLELVDTKDRLNEYLHPFGLHLVLDAADLTRGRANLASYVILSKHSYNILGKPFVVYEVRPAIDGRSTAALGHAEIEPGYMFIFANHVDQETGAGMAFARGESLGLHWPLKGLSDGTQRAIEAAVRRRLADGTGLDPARYRSLLINTIGRHEGFHMYIEPGIAASARRGKVSRGMAGTWHENGAYLYQLELDDPRFIHMDLLMLLVIAMNGNPDFPDNTAGARSAMSDLQQYVKDVKFWDATEHVPVEAGLVALFEKSPDEIQKAASQARWAYEVTVRN